MANKETIGDRDCLLKDNWETLGSRRVVSGIQKVFGFNAYLLGIAGIPDNTKLVILT